MTRAERYARRPAQRGRLMNVVEPAGVTCSTCGRGPYRSKVTAFPHAVRCSLRRLHR